MASQQALTKMKFTLVVCLYHVLCSSVASSSSTSDASISTNSSTNSVSTHDGGWNYYYLFWFDRAIDEFNICLCPTHEATHHLIYDAISSHEKLNTLLCGVGGALATKQPLWHGENASLAAPFLNTISTLHSSLCATATASTPTVPLLNSTTITTGFKGLECRLAEGVQVYLNQSIIAWKREQHWFLLLRSLHDENLHNLDITALYAIAGLGFAANAPNFISREKGEAVVGEMQVVLEEAVLRNREMAMKHAGILHALTHAYDSMNPTIAQKGIVYGLALAQLYNYSVHAIHMVSHLYLAMSEWTRVAEVNEKAWQRGMRDCEGRVACDVDDRFHALEWIHYASIQSNACRGFHDESQTRDGGEEELVFQMAKYFKEEKDQKVAEQLQLWTERMYARQVFKEIECANRYKNSSGSSVKVDVGIAESHGWISRIEMTDTSYWSLYSKSGCLFAQFFVEYYYKTLDVQDGLAAKNKTMYSIREKLEQCRLVAVEKKYSFIDVVVAGYVEVVDSMIRYSITRDISILQSDFLESLKKERGNGRTDAAPTLPVLPLSSLYELVMRREGVMIGETESERIGCGATVRVWGKRIECQNL